MKKIFRNRILLLSTSVLMMGCANATSRGPIELIVKQIGNSPAVCLPMKDARGSNPVQIIALGVSRATGPTSMEAYWDVSIPKESSAFFIKRGECIVYGQSIEGAIIETPPKPLTPGKSYAFSLIPAGDGSGQIYAASFCMKNNGGKITVIQEKNEENPCQR